MNINGSSVCDVVGVLKSTFLNTSVIRLGDNYSLDVDLTCAEVQNSQCLPYIGDITELNSWSDFVIAYNVVQDTGDS